MLFMGQEWAASTPFQFFTDHGGEFGNQVSKGRLKEFENINARWPDDALKLIPDPESEETFLRSKLDWQEVPKASHQHTLALYRKCLGLRSSDPILQRCDRSEWSVWHEGDFLFLRYGPESGPARIIVAHFASAKCQVSMQHSTGPQWETMLSSNGTAFGGHGNDSLVQDRLKFDGPGTMLLARGL